MMSYYMNNHDYKKVELRIKQYHSLVDWLHHNPSVDGEYTNDIRHIVNVITKVYNELDLPLQQLFKLLWWECEPIDVIEDVMQVSARTINKHKQLIIERIANELKLV